MNISKEEVRRRIVAAAPSSLMVTDVDLPRLIENSVIFGSSDSEFLKQKGISLEGSGNCTVCILRPDLNAGSWKIITRGEDGLVIIGEPHPTGNVTIQARLSGKDCTLLFPDLRASSVWLADINMRSDKQSLYWGARSSAVHVQIEIEGADSRVLVGDDCMFSSGIWIRNHDMHAIFDVSTAEVVNAVTKSMVIEQHVWIGQDALLLAVDVIGFGSIIGAKSLVLKSLDHEVLAVGSPARVIRSGVSWSRLTTQVEPHVIQKLRELRALSHRDTDLAATSSIT